MRRSARTTASGNTATLTTTLTAALAIGLALSGCAQSAPAGPGTPSTTTAESTGAPSTGTPSTGAPSTSPSATDSETPVTDVGTVPASCTDLITAGKWDDAFASAPLNDPSVAGDPIAIPKSSFTPALQPDGKRLFCIWADPRADTSFLSIGVDAVDPAIARTELDQLASDGYDCGDQADGYQCQKVSQNTQYPVTDGDTYFTRGDIGIHIRQSNTETSDLLADVIDHVFTA